MLASSAGVVSGRLLATTIRLYGVAHPGPITRDTSWKAILAFDPAGS